MKSLLSDHYEINVLVFIFIFATVMLAVFPGREEMARWIENGAIIAILARAFGSKTIQDPKADTTDGKKQEA